MKVSSKLVWKVYMTALGLASTIVAQKVLDASWKAITGKKPPEPTDPDIPLREAATWALASGLGMGVTQFAVKRFAASRWAKDMGSKAPNIPQIKVKV